jgi:hypothetical protein
MAFPWPGRRSTLAEERRLAYRPTLLEELFEVLREPLQLGMLAGVVAGALAAGALEAARRASARPASREGLVLQIQDPAILARALQHGEQAARQALGQEERLTRF